MKGAILTLKAIVKIDKNKSLFNYHTKKKFYKERINCWI